jgi:antitoxin ParD1/3/4
MTTMNISLPDSMKAFVDVQIQQRGYGSSSEYIRDLIRRDQIRQAEQRLAALMLEGLESGPAIPTDKTYWENKREALRKRRSV